jgi:hypothetical protein
MHAFKEPITIVSRSRSGGSPPRIQRSLCRSSRVLAALDAQKRSKSANDSIQILGPFPAEKGGRGKARQRVKPLVQEYLFKFLIKFLMSGSDSLHPFYSNGSGPDFGPVGSRGLSTPILYDTSDGAPIPMSIPVEELSSKASSSKPDASRLPIYSYKDYLPRPGTVYTRHEEEANDLVVTLRGCVCILMFHVLSVNYLYGQPTWFRHGVVPYISSRRG